MKNGRFLSKIKLNPHKTAGRGVENSNSLVISAESIESRIFLIREQKVIQDKDLALLYGVKVKRLKEQVNRNISRFPEDFMFVLSWEEERSLRSQFATLETLQNVSNASKKGKHSKYRTYVFTEQGIAMLSTVLNSERAIQVNIAIMRAFVKIRRLITFNKEVAQKLSELEHKVILHDRDIIDIFSAINKIIKDEQKPKNRIGFL